jgi:hypothetical protein
MNDTHFVSLWAGIVGSDLPAHLEILYASLGHSSFERDPRVCAELERVPIEELLEPFLLSEASLADAVASAEKQTLHLATTVVAIYTHMPPRRDVLPPSGCGLKFVGTFQVNSTNQPWHPGCQEI